MTVFSEIREESITLCSLHLFMANACLSHERVRAERAAQEPGESVCLCESVYEHHVWREKWKMFLRLNLYRKRTMAYSTENIKTREERAVEGSCIGGW